MGASETETSELPQEESRSRMCTTKVMDDSIVLIASSGANAEGVPELSVKDRASPQQPQDKVPICDSSPVGNWSHIKRAERSWARKAIQSAMMERKSKHIEWYH